MKKIINSELAPAPVGPYSHSVLKNGFLFVSGQIPMNQETGELILEDIEKATHQVMQNLKHILTEAEMDFDDVIKATIFITDMNNFPKVNDVYGSYFTEGLEPARETVEVAGLPRGVHVEISVIASK